MDLRRNLSQLRAERRLTQEQLGRKIGVSGAYISLLESGGKTNPSLGLLVRLARALKVQLGDLLA